MLTANSVEVTWDRSLNVAGYLISCTTTASYAGGKNAVVNGGNTTSHTLTNLVENTPYNITVQGMTRDGTKSPCSNKESVKTSTAGKKCIIIILDMSYILNCIAPSSPPQDIQVSGYNPATLVVSWQPPLEKHCNGPITGYVIQYVRVGIFQSDDKMIMNVSNNSTLTISGLFACAEYSVKVAAVNSNGTGPFSKPVVAITGEDSELN